MTRIEFRGTQSDIIGMKKRFAMMTENGDDTVVFDENDRESIKKVIKLICEELKSGKVLFGGNKGKTELYEIANEHDVETFDFEGKLEIQLTQGAYDRFMLASKQGHDVLLGAIPAGG